MDSPIKKKLFNDSQLKFVQILIEKGEVDVSKLAEMMEVSIATVYNHYNYIKNLTFERKKGKIYLYNDDQTMTESSSIEPFDLRKQLNANLKESAANVIVNQIIKPGDSIFLDCGTSNMAIAEQFIEHNIHDLKIVTNNPYVFCCLHKHNLEQLSVIGGTYNRYRGSFHGTWVDSLLTTIEKDHKFNKAFIGSDGIFANAESSYIYLTNEEERKQKLRIMTMANEVYFPMDQSKIGKAGVILAQTQDDIWKKIKVVMGYETNKLEELKKFMMEFGAEKIILADSKASLGVGKAS